MVAVAVGANEIRGSGDKTREIEASLLLLGRRALLSGAGRSRYRISVPGGYGCRSGHRGAPQGGNASGAARKPDKSGAHRHGPGHSGYNRS